MAFIYNKNGDKVEVDVDLDKFSQKCVIYNDNSILRDCYILNLYKGHINTNESEPDLIKQIEYWDNPPTKEEIMFRMWENNLSRYDIVTVEKGCMLDYEYND